MHSNNEIRQLIDAELAKLDNLSRRAILASILVPPQPLYLKWDYGESGQRFQCWLVGMSPDGNMRLVYCSAGFGPAYPWGHLQTAVESMGMDSQWHAGLEHAAIGAGLLDAPPNYEVP